MFKFILPRFLFKVEQWKWNPEYRIYVSNMGHFKNEYKQDLPIKINNSGYILIKTNCGMNLAHRLVMLTWKPIPNAENLTVDHLDHNKRNNSVNNLEWVTKAENKARAKRDLYAGAGDDSQVENKESKVQIGFQPPVAAKYQAGKKLIFNSLDEAAAWCMKQSGPDLTLEKAKKEIENKCKSGKMYCGRKWKRVK